MAANEGYWGGKPASSEIRRPYMPDASTRLSAYKSGEIDLVQLERADIEGLQADEKYKNDIKLFDRASMYYIGLNVRHRCPRSRTSGFAARWRWRSTRTPS